MAATRLVSNDGTGRLRISDTLPDRATALTIGAWFQSPTVPANRFATMLAPFGAGSNETDLLYITDNYGGGSPVFGVYCGPSLDTFYSSGLAANTAWFHYSIAYSASSATCRIIRDVAGTLTVVATWTVNREAWAATGLDFFNNIYGGTNETAVNDTQVAYARVYAATLDAAALLQEAASDAPTVAVWASWPLQDASLTDASGNGRNLTTSGSITLGNGTSNPPVAPPSAGSAGTSTLTFTAAGVAAQEAAAAGTSSLTFGVSGLVDAGAATGSSTLTFGVSGVAAQEAAVSGTSSLTFSAVGTHDLGGQVHAVAVYRIDEAGSGSAVSTLVDATGHGLDLTVSYVEGDPVFVTGTYGRGFDFNRTSPFGAPGAGAHRQLTNSDVAYTSFSGSRYYVIEAVAEIPNLGAGDEFGPACLAGIFRTDGENDPIGLWWWNRRMIVDVTGQAGYDGGGYTGITFDYVNAAYSPGTLTPGVHVFHAVFDSTQVNAADRLRLYVDGVRQVSSGSTNEGPGDQIVDLNDQIMIPLAGSGLSRAGDHFLCVGGFKQYGFGIHGSWEGAIYWVRLDNSAPSDSTITSRAALLSTSWDLAESYSTLSPTDWSAQGSTTVTVQGSAISGFGWSGAGVATVTATGADVARALASVTASSSVALVVSSVAASGWSSAGSAGVALQGSGTVSSDLLMSSIATVSAVGAVEVGTAGDSSLSFGVTGAGGVLAAGEAQGSIAFLWGALGVGATEAAVSGSSSWQFGSSGVASAEGLADAQGQGALLFQVVGVGALDRTGLFDPQPVSGVVRNLIVRTLTVGQRSIFWDLDPTADPFGMTIQVLRSESIGGPYYPVSPVLRNCFTWVDDNAPAYHQARQVYYVLLVSQAGAGQTLYGPAELDSPDLVTLEVRSHLQHLFREVAGTRAWVFPIRTLGPQCAFCWSAKLGKVTRAGCPHCYGVGFVGGYMTPLDIWIQIDPSNQRQQSTEPVKVQSVNTTARLADWPPLKPDDVIVEASNLRWRVVKVAQTEHSRQVVHQEIELHQIPEGSVEFSLPLPLPQGVTLRDLEITPQRNKTNPFTLESVEPADRVLELVFRRGAGPR